MCILRDALLCAKEKCLPYPSGSWVELGLDERCAREMLGDVFPLSCTWLVETLRPKHFRVLRVLCV